MLSIFVGALCGAVWLTVQASLKWPIYSPCRSVLLGGISICFTILVTYCLLIAYMALENSLVTMNS